MLDPAVDLERDRILGDPNAEMTLVEYGSYACHQCRAVHEVIEGLRSRFGERMRYVFRHLPVARKEATPAAELAEYAAETTGRFWDVHEALMERGPALLEGELTMRRRPAASADALWAQFWSHSPPSATVHRRARAAYGPRREQADPARAGPGPRGRRTKNEKSCMRALLKLSCDH